MFKAKLTKSRLLCSLNFNPNIHGWKRPRGRPKTRWANSIKHGLHSAGLDTINAAQMVFDRPQWKAFVSGLPTLEPEQGSFVKSSILKAAMIMQVNLLRHPLVTFQTPLCHFQLKFNDRTVQVCQCLSTNILNFVVGEIGK